MLRGCTRCCSACSRWVTKDNFLQHVPVAFAVGLADCFLDWLLDWLIGWLIGWLTERLNWVVGCLISLSLDLLIDWLIGGPIYWLTWTIDWWVEWLTKLTWLTDWQTDWLTERTDCLIGWLIICLVNRLLDCLVDYLTVEQRQRYALPCRSTESVLLHYEGWTVARDSPCGPYLSVHEGTVSRTYCPRTRRVRAVLYEDRSSGCGSTQQWK